MGLESQNANKGIRSRLTLWVNNSSYTKISKEWQCNIHLENGALHAHAWLPLLTKAQRRGTGFHLYPGTSGVFTQTHVSILGASGKAQPRGKERAEAQPMLSQKAQRRSSPSSRADVSISHTQHQDCEDCVAANSEGTPKTRENAPVPFAIHITEQKDVSQWLILSFE